jgi:hypothetical protein
MWNTSVRFAECQARSDVSFSTNRVIPYGNASDAANALLLSVDSPHPVDNSNFSFAKSKAKSKPRKKDVVTCWCLPLLLLVLADSLMQPPIWFLAG